MNPKLKLKIQKGSVSRIFAITLILITINYCLAYDHPATEIPKDVNMPVGFIENKGQWPEEVIFLYQSANANHWITKEGLVSDYFIDEIKYSNKSNEGDSYYRKGHVLKYVFNTNINNIVYEKKKIIDGVSFSYFLGNDHTRWASEVNLYKEIIIKNVYDNIDVRWYFDETNNLRYDFIVHPNGSVNNIQIRVEGSNLIYDEFSNKVIIQSSLGNIEHSDLQTFDESNNKLKSSFYILNNTIHINVENADKTNQKITVDPVIYSTFYGNNSRLRYDDGVYSNAVSPASFFILGYTFSATYPATTGAYDQNNNGDRDIVVVRLNANTGGIIKATFIGGSSMEINAGLGKIRVDNSKIYIAARTTSCDYPTTTSALYTSDPYCNTSTGWNAIFSVFNINMSNLLYSTYYEADNFNGLELVSGGGVVLGVNNMSNTLVTTTGAYDNSHNGNWDMGLLILLPDITTFLDPDDYTIAYSTFLGGNDYEFLTDLKVNGNNISISGYSFSNNYPMQNAYDNTHGGGSDAIITVFQFSLTPTPSLTLYYSSYFGTTNDQEFQALSVFGNTVYAVGITKGFDSGINSPFVTGQLNTSNAQWNLWAVAVDISQTVPASQMLYRIYFPGTYDDYGYGCYYANNRLYVSGETTSPDFYITQNAYDCSYNSNGVNSSSYSALNSDAFLLTIEQATPSSTAQVNYSTFYGGTSWDNAIDVIVVNTDVHLLGFTGSSNFPFFNFLDNTFGAWDKPFAVKLTIPEPLPIISTSYSPVQLCDAANVTLGVSSNLSGVVNNYLWSNNVSGANNPISNLSSGNYTYTVTTTLNSGCRMTNTVSFVVNPNPNVTINATPNPVCEGANMALQVNSPGNTITNYQWVGPNSFSANISNPSITNISLLQAGVYTVTTTNNFNCTRTATVNITVNPNPTVNLSYNTSVCEASPLLINTTTNASNPSYQWSGPNSYSNNTSSVNIPSAQLNQGGTYTVTVTNGVTGCSVTSTASVTVNPLPVINVTNNTPVCQDGNVSLTANVSNVGVSQYMWTFPNSTTQSGANVTITNAQPSHAGNYMVQATSIHNCVSSTQTTVVVNPNPVINPSSNSPVCEGLTLNLNANGTGGGITYNWTGPMSYSATGNTTSINNVQLGHTGTYVVTATNTSTSCISTGSVDVVINPVPVLNPTSNSPVCENGTLQLNVNTVPNGNYTWSGPNISGMNQQNFSINPVSLADGGTYTVSVTDMNGCFASATTSVIINALPSIQAFSNSPVCEEGTLYLFALSNSTNASFNWIGPHGFSNGNANPSISPVSTFHNGIFSVTVTDMNTMCTNSTSTNVVINPLPQSTIVTSVNELTKCEKESVTLSVIQDPIAASYQWVGPGGATYNNSDWVLNNLNANQSGTYTVTVTSNQGCTRSSSVNLTVNPKPMALFVVDRAAGCSEHCMNFNDLSMVSGSATITAWDWRNDGVGFSNSQNPNLCITNNGSSSRRYDIQLIVTSSDGCKDTLLMNDMIEVFPRPISNFITDKFDYTILDNILFQDQSVGNMSVTNWNWDMGDGTVYSNANITHSYADTGVYTVTLTTTNNYGCTSSVSYVYHINEEFTFYIPNSFTPNRDMINDIWNVKGRGIKEFRMEIYNRWGERIYETDDYTLGWPGTYKTTNEKVQAGTYTYKIYVFDVHNKEHNYIGHVNVIY